MDTDIGDDIDDLLALAYALEKNVNLVGVTTVYREANERAAIAKKVLKIKGREDIPVYAGHSETIGGNRLFGKLHYTADEPATTSDPDKAVDFIIECAERYGSDLCVLAIGAQTNVAKAWLKAPEAMRKIGRLAIMGGCFTTQHNEWNIACDPTAARIVAESDMSLFYMPWNVTRDLYIGEENYAKILSYRADDLQGYVAELVRRWRERNEYVPLLHDPSTLICVLDESLCKTETAQFCVIDEGAASGITLNASLLNPLAAPDFFKKTIELVTEADREGIVNEFMETAFRV